MNSPDTDSELINISLRCLLTPSLPQAVNFLAERWTEAPANSVISGPIASTFNAVCFDKDRFTCQCEKEDKKA